MKLRADQLQSHLQQTLLPIYIISGDEVLLVQEAADAIRKIVKHKGIDERLRFSVDSQFDWQDLIHENQSLSLFSSRRLFDIHIDKLAEKHTKALQELAQVLSPDNLVLLTLPKLDMRTQKSKWFTLLEKIGAFIPIWPIDSAKTPQWLQQRAQNLGLALPREAALLLSERAEGNLLAMSQDIEKLLLIYGKDTKLSVEHVADVVADSSRYSVYDLSDQLLEGQVKAALHCLEQLFAEGIDSNIILWMITREITTLRQLLEISVNTSIRQACQQLKIWDKRIPLYEKACLRHNHFSITYLQRYVALLDRRVKGLEGPELSLGFLNTILMLCGIKTVTTELDL